MTYGKLYMQSIMLDTVVTSRRSLYDHYSLWPVLVALPSTNEDEWQMTLSIVHDNWVALPDQLLASWHALVRRKSGGDGNIFLRFERSSAQIGVLCSCVATYITYQFSV